MSKIKTTKQFKDGIDAAFETQKTRDEAKACYDFSRASDSATRRAFVGRAKRPGRRKGCNGNGEGEDDATKAAYDLAKSRLRPREKPLTKSEKPPTTFRKVAYEI